jgi:hypothetical protein
VLHEGSGGLNEGIHRLAVYGQGWSWLSEIVFLFPHLRYPILIAAIHLTTTMPKTREPGGWERDESIPTEKIRE